MNDDNRRQERLDGLEVLRWTTEHFEQVSEICYAAADEPAALAGIMSLLDVDIDMARTALITGFIDLDVAARERVAQMTVRVRNGS